MHTDFLFAQPSLLTGAARVLDLSGSFDKYNYCRTGEEADVRALVGDWLAVAYALRLSWSELVKEHPEFIEQLAVAISSDEKLFREVLKQAEDLDGEEAQEEVLQSA